MKRLSRTSETLLAAGAALALVSGCSSNAQSGRSQAQPSPSEAKPTASSAPKAEHTYGIGVLLGHASMLPERTNKLCFENVEPEGRLIRCNAVETLKSTDEETLQIVGSAIVSRCVSIDGKILPMQKTVSAETTREEVVQLFDRYEQAYGDGDIVTTPRNVGHLSCIERIDATNRFQTNVPVGTPFAMFEQ